MWSSLSRGLLWKQIHHHAPGCWPQTFKLWVINSFEIHPLVLIWGKNWFSILQLSPHTSTKGWNFKYLLLHFLEHFSKTLLTGVLGVTVPILGQREGGGNKCMCGRCSQRIIDKSAHRFLLYGMSEALGWQLQWMSEVLCGAGACNKPGRIVRRTLLQWRVRCGACERGRRGGDAQLTVCVCMELVERGYQKM